MAKCDNYIKCRLCGEKILFHPKCQCILGDHLLKKHPEVEVTYFGFEHDNAEESTSDSKSKSSRKRGVSFTKFKNTCSRSHSRDTMYKTTVETWAAGPVKIACPACNSFATPCIRKQRNKVAYSSLGALCLLGCWPLCFLPFLSSDTNIHLFCKNCGKYLGEYNRKNGILIPPKDGDKNLPPNQCTCKE